MRASPLDLFEQPAKGFLSILLGKKKLANAKLEIRYSKQIQKGNTKQIPNTMFQTGGIGLGVLDFLVLNSFWPRFVSVRGASFDIRISDFVSACFLAR